MERPAINYVIYLLWTVLLLLMCGYCSNKNSKRTEIEEELYKNVLPYIQIVADDAAETKQEIQQSKTKSKHSNKAALLKELDQKVLPWLNEITSKVNSLAEGKMDEVYANETKKKRPHHHIKGPTALNSNQEDQLLNGTSSLTQKQESMAQYSQPNSPSLQEYDENNNPLKPLKQRVSQLSEQGDREIESDVANLTNQIAEFQQEMNTLDMDFPEMDMNNNNMYRRHFSKLLPDKKTDKSFRKSKHRLSAVKANSGSVKIIFGGNIGFDGIIRYKVEKNVCTYNESFDRVRKFFQKADHVVMNLDTPFQFGEQSNKKLVDDGAAESLRYAGIDTIVLANAHIFDDGPKPATFTAALLRQNNILFSGFTLGRNTHNLQEPVIYTTNGVTIGMLSYCMNFEGCSKIRNESLTGPAIFNESIIKQEVIAIRESGIDVVILYLHWGNEDTLTPAYKIKEIVRNLSEVKIDALIGSHPNVEGHYFHRGCLVVFSLGNLLSSMHMHTYKPQNGGSKSAKLIRKLWDRQSERWEMPSSYSKLLQIEVNRDGLIPFKSKYLPIRISVNKNHCIQPQKIPKEWWIPICSSRDKQCFGSSKCNELECDGTIKR